MTVHQPKPHSVQANRWSSGEVTWAEPQMQSVTHRFWLIRA
jgi:hypothetical protein